MRVVTVVTGGGASRSTCFTTLFTDARFTFVRLTRWGRSARLTVPALASLISTGRSGGLVATVSAPPPMMAPPQVQAANFANAILTDMTPTLF